MLTQIAQLDLSLSTQTHTGTYTTHFQLEGMM
jgi:hypothetical protein